jgi:hypothetical protein
MLRFLLHEKDCSSLIHTIIIVIIIVVVLDTHFIAQGLHPMRLGRS